MFKHYSDPPMSLDQNLSIIAPENIVKFLPILRIAFKPLHYDELLYYRLYKRFLQLHIQLQFLHFHLLLHH